MSKTRAQVLKRREEDDRRRKAKFISMLRTFNDPSLKTVCEPIVQGDNLDFLRAMKQVCIATDTGVGLAAPQIGVLKRAIFLWPKRQGLYYWMLNPQIVMHSEDTCIETEGCLSYPNVWAPILRHTSITVDYLDQDFTRYTKHFSGWEARVIQHEVDHLQGICLVGDAWRQSKFS